MKTLASGWVGTECFRGDTDRAFFVGLKQALQREYFDLAVVTLERLLAILARLDPTAEISAGIRSRLSRSAAMLRLKQREGDLRDLGVTALYLFGSTARDEAGPNSDVDVFVEHGPGFSLLDLAGVEQIIADDIGADVHATTRESLHPAMRAAIEREAVQVF